MYFVYRTIDLIGDVTPVDRKFLIKYYVTTVHMQIKCKVNSLLLTMN
jgi:hypothetical protein